MAKIRSLLGGAVKRHGGLVFRWEPGLIIVEFPNQRMQSVRYLRDGEYFVFVSKVAGRAVVEGLGRDLISKEILLRNRVTDVVCFRFDGRGAVEGVVEQRADTLQPAEAIFYISLLARESDRFEFLLTGKDHH